LTVTLEGQGKRWQKRMSVTNGDDIPPGWTCPREDGTPALIFVSAIIAQSVENVKGEDPILGTSGEDGGE
jgi:hypothetical protein